MCYIKQKLEALFRRKFFTIKATNETIKKIVEDEIYKLGYEADLNHIDVSEVTDMDCLFYNSKFNGDISLWNVSNVTNMSFMFHGSKFNGNITQWDVSKVTDMSHMFFSSSDFFQNIFNWKVSSGTDISQMFWGTHLSKMFSKERLSNMLLCGEFNKLTYNYGEVLA